LISLAALVSALDAPATCIARIPVDSVILPLYGTTNNQLRLLTRLAYGFHSPGALIAVV
jgi:hypothetical protein